tara:strand:+ start:3499 stop:4497 length:999 start_codon:yes stop_codon:yes gene_type:complete
MKKILILGSGSFSGSSLINFLLRKNYKIFGINRTLKKNKYFLPFEKNIKKKNFTNFILDINKIKDREMIYNIIKKNKINYIVDFLGQGMVSQSWDKPQDWVNTNILSKINLIEKIIRQKINIKKYIKISTPEVYGSVFGKIKKTNIYNPSTPYAVSHASIDMILKTYYEKYNFPIVIGRFSNFYGDHQQLYRIIPRVIFAVLKNGNFFLEGNGNSKRNFLYKDDFCNGIYLMLLKGKVNNIYHFSGKNVISIKNLVTKICKIMGCDKKAIVRYKKERSSLDKVYKMDTYKTRSKLKWSENVSLEEGIKNTVNYMKNNFKLIKNLDPIYKHKK